MDKAKADIWVYAHWAGMKAPRCIGILSAHFGKGRKSFSFEYDKNWISSDEHVSDWRKYASSIGIPKAEQEMMTPAFRF